MTLSLHDQVSLKARCNFCEQPVLVNLGQSLAAYETQILDFYRNREKDKHFKRALECLNVSQSIKDYLQSGFGIDQNQDRRSVSYFSSRKENAAIYLATLPLDVLMTGLKS